MTCMPTTFVGNVRGFICRPFGRVNSATRAIVVGVPPLKSVGLNRSSLPGRVLLPAICGSCIVAHDILVEEGNVSTVAEFAEPC